MTSIELKQGLRPSGRFATGVSLGLVFASAMACNPGNIGGDPSGGSAGNTSLGAAGNIGGTAGTTVTPGSAGAAGSNPNVITAPTSPAGYNWYGTLMGADCSAAPTAFPATRIWRLSATQWANTVASALGVSAPNVTSFPGDTIEPRTGYSDDSTINRVTLGLATAYFDAADAAATTAAPGAITAIPCLGTAPIPVACGQMFASTYGQRLFRRAVTPAEATSFANYLNSESKLDPAATAVASTLKAMLLSPNFMYRTELGTSKAGMVDMTQDEIASALSYTIADVPPDAALVTAAAAGQLSDPAVREAQAVRLAALPGAKTKLQTFWREYLALGQQPTMTGLDGSMLSEAMNFFNKVVWDGKGTFKDLMTAPYTYADTAVAAVYGTAKPATDGKLTLDPTQRSGFLTSASILTKTAASSQAATVIHRGLLVRQRVLCETPPPPPGDVVPDPTQIQQAGADATAKENYDYFAMAKPSCNACHSAFQPLGLAFESYDGAGKFRTKYPSGKPVLTDGTLTNAGDATGPYANVVEMATKIGGSQIAGYCLAQQFATFAFGRGVGFAQEGCTIRGMGDYVANKGGGIQQLFASLATAPTAFKRFHQ